MSDLQLFIDPYEIGYPSTVREHLINASRKTIISGTVTQLGRCLLICDNSIFVWQCVSKEKKCSKEVNLPASTRMDLAPSGLKYSIQLVCLFSKGQELKQTISLLAISPEGNVRYWAELGKAHREETCLLNNEVAQSLQLVDSQDQVHRFLVTTTTGSFHIIDIFHTAPGQPERMASRPLDVGGPGGGIGRRMSLLLFGNASTERERILKTLFIRGKIGSADVVNVLPRYLRFYSIFQRPAQLHEVDVSDMALLKYNKGRDQSQRRHFLIEDAADFRSGILLFLVSSLQSQDDIRSDKRLFIAFYEEIAQRDGVSRVLSTLIPVDIPESLNATGMDKRLQRAQLLVTSVDECTICFPDSLLHIEHPTKPNTVSISCLDNLGTANERLLGAAAVHGCCQLVLKEKGLCTVRRLPSLYDLGFWKKYRSILHRMEEPSVFPGSEQRLKEAFIEFCAKNIKRTNVILNDLFASLEHPMEEAEESMEGMEFQSVVQSTITQQKKADEKSSMAEMTVDLNLYLLDRKPSMQEDPRWSYTSNASMSNEQKERLHELASTRKFALILKHLGDKHAHYKMTVLFLRTFNLLEWIDHPVPAFQNRTGKALVAELGEKLAAMIVCFHWLANNAQSLPLVNAAIGKLAKEYVIRFGLPKHNPYLSPIDLVFSRVSSFHDLVPAMVQASEQAMEEDVDKSKVLAEVGNFLIKIIEGIGEMHREEWALQMEDEHDTWLNQPEFLTHFTTQLNTALDYLQSCTDDCSAPNSQDTSIIFDQCVQLANFVLSQQSPSQRDDSKIISRFATLGKKDVALGLAEKYKDFTMLIVYCHNNLGKRDCARALEHYKEVYEKDGFHDFLYTWYQQNGMYANLLAEGGERVNNFLAQHQNINCFRQIDMGNYKEAGQTLRKMAEAETDERKKMIAFSLAKMSAMCEEEEDPVEIAELSEQIRKLHDKENSEGVRQQSK